MLIQLMQAIAIFYYWTWFVWPFVLVYSFAFGIADIIKNEGSSGKALSLTAVSLLIILAGIVSPAFS